jgi:Ca-activated chloride channel family protein
LILIKGKEKKSNIISIKKFCLIFFLLFSITIKSQEETQIFNKRILFILDGSGSMNERWQSETKWDMAISTLSSLIDSFEKVNKDFEIGIRVLGHQYHKNMQRCDDSKLEIPFSKELTFEKVNNRLQTFTPKGYTPLAYSISESEKDFGGDVKTQNVIILITDGLENCNGNPCEVANRLREKNIFINPYIIGLGIDSMESQNLECIGKYIDAKNKEVFKQVIQTILSEVAVRTTLTVQFVKSDSSTYTNYVPFSLIEKRGNVDMHNLIFTSNTKRSKDTININPQYSYNLLVHTNPPFYHPNFTIVKGRHQHYTIPVITGEIKYDNPYKNKRNQYLLRPQKWQNNLWHTGIQSNIHWIDSHMIIDYNMHPMVRYSKVNIKEGGTYDMPTGARGTLVLKRENKELLTLYNKNWDKILTFNNDIVTTIDIAIGDYYLLFKKRTDHSENTKYRPLKIVENQTTNILIE